MVLCILSRVCSVMTPEEINQYVDKLSSTLQTLTQSIESIESKIKQVKTTLITLGRVRVDEAGKIYIPNEALKNDAKTLDPNSKEIEGFFDGYFMVGTDGNKYPVPINYASKSQLVPGDKLKITIRSDGGFFFRIVGFAERQHLKAILTQQTDNTSLNYYAITSEKATYRLNSAAVSFFKGLPGDEVYIAINKNGEGTYAALEAVIKQPNTLESEATS